jgi:hypothetical protein
VQEPDFYLASTEHRGDWRRVRACFVTAVTHDQKGTACLWLRIEPPVDRGTSTAEVVVAPHFEGTRVWPEPHFPTPVFVYAPKGTRPGSRERFEPEHFELVAWAEIYATRPTAESAISASGET